MSEEAKLKCSSLGNATIFGECLEMLEWNHFRTWCEYDMCARGVLTDDTPMCIMLAALAKECSSHGVMVSWSDYVCQGKKRFTLL